MFLEFIGPNRIGRTRLGCKGQYCMNDNDVLEPHTSLTSITAYFEGYSVRQNVPKTGMEWTQFSTALHAVVPRPLAS